MAGKKKKASRRPSGAKDGAERNVEPEDISPQATASQSLQEDAPASTAAVQPSEAIESQSQQMSAPPSTALQPGELNSEDKTMEKAEKGFFENTAELGRNLFSLD